MDVDAYLGEIRLLSFDFYPRGWVPCEGQLLAINQYDQLFSLLGTTFGGNGTTNFALPDLRGRVAVGTGHAPGMGGYPLGHKGGHEYVLPTTAQLPAHSHRFKALLDAGKAAEAPEPEGGLPALGPVKQFATGSANAVMAPDAVIGLTSIAGGGQPHENRQPLIALTYAIAVEGIVPPPHAE